MSVGLSVGGVLYPDVQDGVSVVGGIIRETFVVPFLVHVPVPWYLCPFPCI